MLKDLNTFAVPEAYSGNQVDNALGALLYDSRKTNAASGRSMAIRLADSDGARDNARMIINRLYDWRGYGAHHQIADHANCVTFTAYGAEEMVGTLTLTVDTSGRLAADETFADELDRFRARPGASLCELTKFAFDPSPDSRPLLAALFHVIFIYGTQRFDCTDLFIEVNPRHVRFYEVMLGFERVGALRTNVSVDAPSQLMHLKVADIRRNIDAAAGIGNIKGHSLYPLFFDLAEEQELRRKIAGRAPDCAIDRHSSRGKLAHGAAQIGQIVKAPFARRRATPRKAA